MVSYKEVKASNALINDATAPRIAVFVGGTSGVGKLTIKALVGTGASVRIYLVGRKSSKERSNAFIQELQAINSKAEIVWTEGEISLLADSKRVCELIKEKESRIDLLFLTAGYAPFGTRKETAEGLEICQALEYYSRILFIQHLLPLLSKSEAPRVVSVLGGGMEQAAGFNMFKVDDLDLKKPGNFVPMIAQVQYVNMTTTAMDKLAADNPKVTFIHSAPGWVNTGNLQRSQDDANPNSFLAWFSWLVLKPLVSLMSFSDEESGQRNLFQSTSAAFGGRGIPWNGKPSMSTLEKPGEGLFLVGSKCNSSPNVKVMSFLREKALDKVWDHTQEVLRPYL